MKNLFFKKPSIKEIAAYILGLSTSVYVINLGNVGYTTIRLDLIVSIFLFFLLITRRNAINNLILHFNKYILIFSIFMIFSGINVIFYSTTLGHGDRFLKALIIYLISIMTYSCVILLKDNKNSIIKGLVSGLILNVGFSLVQYFTFKAGNYLTLYNMFPQASFYIPIYNFRTQGFFLEPSHMMQFITSTFLLFLLCYKATLLKKIITLILVLVILMSKSGNALVLLLVLILYYFFSYRRKNNRIKTSSLFLIIISSVLIIINVNFIVSLIINEFKINYLLTRIFTGFDVTDAGNVDRIAGMTFAIDLIKQYPLGIGYGMSKTLYDLYGNAITSFNYLLTLQLEIGVLGVIAYLMRIYSMGLMLVLKRLNNYQIALGISIVGSEICAILNGGYFGNALWVLYGLASIELYSIKRKNVGTNP